MWRTRSNRHASQLAKAVIALATYALLIVSPTRVLALPVCDPDDRDALDECYKWSCNSTGWYQTPAYAGTACNGGTCDGSGNCVTAPLRVKGKYLITSFWYAAPGTGSQSIYSYQSSTGTSVSTTNGNQNSFSVGIQNQAGFLGLMAGAYDVSFSQVWSKSSTNKIDAISTYKIDNTVPGPGFEYIDHNFDQIVLLLGPDILYKGYLVNGQLNHLAWALDVSRAIQYPIQVGWLNGAFGAMPSNMLADLYLWAGVTPDDFPEMLHATAFAADPTGLGQPDSARFECINSLYFQPSSPNYENYSISNQYSSADTTVVSHTYSVKLALTGTWLMQKLNASDTWTWSNSTSTTNSVGTVKSAQVSLHQPQVGYSGPTVLFVYMDKAYKTMMYSFVAPAVQTTSCPQLPAP